MQLAPFPTPILFACLGCEAKDAGITPSSTDGARLTNLSNNLKRLIGHGRKVMKDGDIDHECGVICTTIYQSVADYHGVIETNNMLMHEEKMRFARLDIVLIQE